MFKIQIWQFIESRFIDGDFKQYAEEAAAWRRVMREVRETEKDMGRFKVVPV